MAESKAKTSRAKPSRAKPSRAKPSGTRKSNAEEMKMAPAAVNMRGLKCPLPTLKTRKLLSKMAPGEVLVIECTDPLTTIDIPNLARETGDKIEDSIRSDRVLTFRIRKS
jgi:tRNA 2-thiouridine synthesizing protein A